MKSPAKIKQQVPSDLPGFEKFEVNVPECYTGPIPLYYYIGRFSHTYVGPDYQHLTNLGVRPDLTKDWILCRCCGNHVTIQYNGEEEARRGEYLCPDCNLWFRPEN